MRIKQVELNKETLRTSLYPSGTMQKIKRLEVLDCSKNGNFLIDLPDVLKAVNCGENLHWGFLPIFDPMGVHEQNARKVSAEVRKQIFEKGLAIINWNELMVLASGVCQFFDLVLIGCQDPKNLKPYQNDDEMIKSCDIAIVMFDTSRWEISCKDEKQMQNFLDTFKDIRIVNW